MKVHPDSNVIKKCSMMWVELGCVMISVLMGALTCLLYQFTNSFGSDGTSYLDMASAFVRQDWAAAVNAQWSPLYPVILGLFFKLLPLPAYWDCSIAHLANFVIYLIALFSFRMFLHRFLDWMHSRSGSLSANHFLSKNSIYVLGYTLFISMAMDWVKIKDINADMLVVAIYLAVCSVMIRTLQNGLRYKDMISLGLLMGLGYLAKAVMLPMGFVFLVVMAAVHRRDKQMVTKLGLAVLILGLLAGPWMAALSKQKGRFTTGDAGKLVYAASVHGITLPTFGDASPEMSQFKHPPRKILDEPEVYEYASPVGGTFPLWYDPSYWLEGMKAPFNFKKILSSSFVWTNYTIRNVFCSYFPGALLFWMMIVILSARERRKELLTFYPLWIPAIILIGLYSVLHGDLRYIAAPFLVIWICCWSCIAAEVSIVGRAWLRALTITIPVIIFLSIGYSWMTADLLESRPDLERRSFGYKSHGGLSPLVSRIAGKFQSHPDAEIAQAIHDLGVGEGDGIAVIGDPFRISLWARIARVRIIAEIPPRAVKAFDEGSPQDREQVYAALKNAGVRALVAQGLTYLEPRDKWQRLANSKYFIYLLAQEENEL